MTIKFVGKHIRTYYCYDDKCPVRTEKEPWPRSDGKKDVVLTMSRKGNLYNRTIYRCVHCGEEMTRTSSISGGTMGYDY